MHTIFNAWAYALKIELKETVELTTEFYNQARGFINLCLMGRVDANSIKSFFQHLGLARAESFAIVDQSHQRYTTFMNDQVLDWFVAANSEGTSDGNTRHSTDGGTHHHGDNGLRNEDEDCEEGGNDENNGGNENDNDNKDQSGRPPSRYDLMDHIALLSIAKSRNIPQPHNSSRQNSIQALLIFDGTAKQPVFNGKKESEEILKGPVAGEN